MYLLTEAIRIENKELQHIDLHNCRINKARKIVFGQTESIDLSKIINIPTNIGNERYKCRVIFHTDKTEYEIHPYVQRKIETLKVVHHNTIELHSKTPIVASSTKPFRNAMAATILSSLKMGS